LKKLSNRSVVAWSGVEVVFSEDSKEGYLVD